MLGDVALLRVGKLRTNATRQAGCAALSTFASSFGVLRLPMALGTIGLLLATARISQVHRIGPAGGRCRHASPLLVGDPEQVAQGRELHGGRDGAARPLCLHGSATRSLGRAWAAAGANQRQQWRPCTRQRCSVARSVPLPAGRQVLRRQLCLPVGRRYAVSGVFASRQVLRRQRSLPVAWIYDVSVACQ